MFENVLFVVLSLGLLFIGAEGLVRGSSSLAMRAGMSRLVVGLTIVAFGTSSPELVVSVDAALSGQGNIAVGNVVGSNLFNIGVILAITALVCPIPVHAQVIRLDAPIALGVAGLASVLLLDDRLGRGEGALLVAGIVAYTVMNFIMARRQGGTENGAEPWEVRRHWALDALFVGGGLGVLVLGSRLLVDNAVALAQALGISEAVIGLTIVAAGTSMPELATSVVAAFRKQPDIAIGNIVGSNVFNMLGILGIASLTTPLDAPAIATLDYVAMIVLTALLLPLLYTGRRLHRVEGGLLLLLYGGYLAYLWPT